MQKNDLETGYRQSGEREKDACENWTRGRLSPVFTRPFFRYLTSLLAGRYSRVTSVCFQFQSLQRRMFYVICQSICLPSGGVGGLAALK